MGYERFTFHANRLGFIFVKSQILLAGKHSMRQIERMNKTFPELMAEQKERNREFMHAAKTNMPKTPQIAAQARQPKPKFRNPSNPIDGGKTNQFVPGKIYARKGRHFVQSSYDPNWPKYAVFGANPSRWLDTLPEALRVMDATVAADRS